MRCSARILSFLVAVFASASCIAVRAQPPFTTEDSDVGEKGEFAVEIVNEHDLLQRSLYPNRRQNTAFVNIEYGLTKNVEISAELPWLVIFNARGTDPRRFSGFSDLGLQLKARFRKEKEHSRWPALAAAFRIRFPTGDSVRSLGSGVTNYEFVGIAEKGVGRKVAVRMNGGILFAGNTEVGVLGITTHKGKLFSGGISVVKQYSKKLSLGAELTGVVSRNFDLSEGQLQTTMGGNYSLNKHFKLDFGVIAGRFPASPRVGGVAGLSLEF